MYIMFFTFDDDTGAAVIAHLACGFFITCMALLAAWLGGVSWMIVVAEMKVILLKNNEM